MPTNLPYPSNPPQPLSPTEEGHVSFLVCALVSEEVETARIAAIADPVRRQYAKQDQRRYSLLGDCAFILLGAGGHMIPKTVFRTVYQAFQLGYLEILDTRKHANPFSLDEDDIDNEKERVAERFRQVGLRRRPDRHVKGKGYRLSLTDTGRSFVQALRASREGAK